MESRTEIRFFLPADFFTALVNNINTVGNFKPIVYPKPITETIYFFETTNPEEKWDTNQLIRFRRYLEKPTKTINPGQAEGFLEIKIQIRPGKNQKQREPTTYQKALAMILAMPTFSNFQPYLAIQSERQHWLSEQIRLTVDSQITFFAFDPTNRQKAKKVGRLGEVKLEIKSTNPNWLELNELCQKLTDQIPCHLQPTNDYMKERSLLCVRQALCKRNTSPRSLMAMR